MDIASIEAAIPKLSDEDFARLEKAVALRRAFGGAGKAETVTTKLSTDELIVLEVLASYMTHIGVDAASAGMLAKTSNFQAFKRKIPALMETLKQSKLTRNETRAVIRSAIDMLYHRLVDQGLDTTSRRMMDHIHRLPALLDVNFPGYAMMGHLRLTVRGTAKNANEEDDG